MNESETTTQQAHAQVPAETRPAKEEEVCRSVLSQHQFDPAVIENLEACAEAGRALVAVGAKRLGSQIACALAMQDMQSLLLNGGPRMAALLDGMQNNPMYFKADQKYPAAVVAECVTQACMLGLDIVGNQFNIIQGRFYLTKEGLDKLLCDMGIPHAVVCHPYRQGESIKGGVDRNGRQMADINMVIIPVTLSWMEGGQDFTQELEFQVRMNANTTPDNVNGKATRKAYKWLYDKISSQSGRASMFRVDDGDASDARQQAAAPKIIQADANAARRKGDPAEIERLVAEAIAATGSNADAHSLLQWLRLRGRPVRSMADCTALCGRIEAVVEAFNNAESYAAV